MPNKISQILGVSEKDLLKHGVFDGFVDFDSLFYIDPHLLESSSAPEIKQAYFDFKKHFEDVIHLLCASKRKGDLFYLQAVRRLTFKEIPLLALGYGGNNTGGKGVGEKLAEQIIDTASEIVTAGIKDPVIFELVGLFQEGIGADRISDMTIFIALPQILKYTERVAKELKIPTYDRKAQGVIYKIPFNPKTRKPIILLPRDVLVPLPIAFCWDDIEDVISKNETLRNQVNRTVGKTWQSASKRISKSDLREILLNNPDKLKKLIEEYKNQPIRKYDFVSDPVGEIIWHETAQKYAESYPLELEEPASANELLGTVVKICHHFRLLVEDNGLFQLLYDDQKNRKHERAAQLLFFGVADAYCQANNLDLSREPNAGRGPVDFKISKGYSARINVEVKYSSNPQLLHGYTKQLAVYNKAEKTDHSIYLIIKTTNSESTIKSLIDLRGKGISDGKHMPEIIIIDGRSKPTGSNV